jgi:hypothetical protein
MDYPIIKRGRPYSGGRSTKVARIPKDMDIEVVKRLYYDLLPTLVAWEEATQNSGTSPRYDAMRKLFDDLGIDDRMREAGK